MNNPLLTYFYDNPTFFISYDNKTYHCLHPFLPCSTLTYMYYNSSHITLPHRYKQKSQFTILYYSY